MYLCRSYLPVFVFCVCPLCVLGRYTERFQVATLLGLVVVSAGLYIYQVRHNSYYRYRISL